MSIKIWVPIFIIIFKNYAIIEEMTGVEFISESILPGKGSFSADAMATGEPDFPGSFTWRGREYEVLELRESWKTTGRDLGGSRERYVRRHWFRVLVSGEQEEEAHDAEGVDNDRLERAVLEMVIYFDRQQRSTNRKRRWWLYTKGL